MKNPGPDLIKLFVGYHNVDIYDRRKIEHREPNVEIYGRISLVPMVDYITSKAKVELVSLVVFLTF